MTCAASAEAGHAEAVACCRADQRRDGSSVAVVVVAAGRRRRLRPGEVDVVQAVDLAPEVRDDVDAGVDDADLDVCVAGREVESLLDVRRRELPLERQVRLRIDALEQRVARQVQHVAARARRRDVADARVGRSRCEQRLQLRLLDGYDGRAQGRHRLHVLEPVRRLQRSEVAHRLQADDGPGAEPALTALKRTDARVRVEPVHLQPGLRWCRGRRRRCRGAGYDREERRERDAEGGEVLVDREVHRALLERRIVVCDLSFEGRPER